MDRRFHHNKSDQLSIHRALDVLEMSKTNIMYVSRY